MKTHRNRFGAKKHSLGNKSSHTRIFKRLSIAGGERLEARMLLAGSPLQSSLQDLWSLTHPPTTQSIAQVNPQSPSSSPTISSAPPTLSALSLTTITDTSSASSAAAQPPVSGDVAAAAASPVIEPLATNPSAILEYRLEAEDAVTGQPVTSIAVGQNFQLAAFAKDLRNPPAAHGGVFAGFLNVAYDPLATIPVGETTVNHGDVTPLEIHGVSKAGFFTLTPSGSLSTGQIVGAGGAATSLAAPGAAEQPLWTLTMHAASAGVEHFSSSFDSSSGHDSLLYDLDPSVTAGQIQFDNSTANTPLQLTITAAPTVVLPIGLPDANLTNAGTVHFTVNFSVPVMGVNSNDFTTVTTGAITGAAVTGVSPTGTASSYTVTVNTGSGNGTIALSLLGTNTITDTTSVPLAGTFPITSAAYTIDKTPPTVSFTLPDTTPTTAATVHFTVNFSKNVTGVTASDFTLVSSGVSGASIASNVSGSGSAYTVTVNTGSGDGTLALKLLGSGTIVDLAGNPLAGPFPMTTPAYTIDKPPSVTSIAIADTSPTNSATVRYTVTFSKSVTGVDETNFTDFGLVATGTISGQSITGVSGSGSTYTVTVNTGSGDGTLALKLIDNHTIKDSENVGLSGTFPFVGTSPYTIDKTPPTASFVVPSSTPTNAATVQFTVNFSESVTGVTANDFTLTPTGAITGESITGVNGNGTSTITVTVNTGSGDGTLKLQLSSAGTIIDTAGNALAGPFPITSSIFTIDKTAPTASFVVPSSTPTSAATVQFTVNFSENVTGVAASDFTLISSGVSGALITNVTGSGSSTATVTVSTGTGDGTLAIKIANAGTIVDLAGNALAGPFPITSSPFTIDKPPSVTSIAIADTSPTNSATVHYTVTFSKSVTGVDTTNFTDFQLVATGTISGQLITGVSGGGSTYTVTASTGSGDGTLALKLVDNHTIKDSGNMGLSGTFPFVGPSPYAIDRTAPTVVGPIGLSDPTTTSLATVHFTVNFSESVTGVTTGDFTPLAGSGLTGSSITSVSGNGSSAITVTVNSGTGKGTLELQLTSAGTITDIAGNLLSSATFPISSSPYAIDTTSPVAQNDGYSVLEGGTLTVPLATGVLANDTDPDDPTLTAHRVAASGPAHGTLTAFNADGSFTYVPNADFNGTDTFTYTANDGTSDSNVGTVTITVTAVNDQPVRTAGTVKDLTVLEDSGLTSLGLGGLAYGPGGSGEEASQTLTFTVTAVPAASLGNIVLADGTTAVTANASYTLTQLQGMQFETAANAIGGPAIFSWSVKDNGGTTNGGIDTLNESLNVTVSLVNDQPVRTAGSVSDLNLQANAGVTSLGLGGLAYGPGGTGEEASQTLTFTVTSVPAASLGNIVLVDGTTVVTVNTSYTLTQLQGMKFSPATNGTGGAGAFSWKVTDNGGTANGGIDTLNESLTINNTVFTLSDIGGVVLVGQGSTPLSGVTVTLNGTASVSDSNLALPLVTQTGANGQFDFANIPPGTWQVTYSQMAHFGAPSVTVFNTTIGPSGGVHVTAPTVTTPGLDPKSFSLHDLWSLFHPSSTPSTSTTQQTAATVTSLAAPSVAAATSATATPSISTATSTVSPLASSAKSTNGATDSAGAVDSAMAQQGDWLNL